MDILSVILGIILLICGILVLSAAYGLLCNTNNDKKNIIFGRLQIFGIVDMVSVLVLILIGQPALGLVYFVMTPFVVHAIANGHYYGEQGEH
jgi:energy-converting hydrogenase B subunit C